MAFLSAVSTPFRFVSLTSLSLRSIKTSFHTLSFRRILSKKISIWASRHMYYRSPSRWKPFSALNVIWLAYPCNSPPLSTSHLFFFTLKRLRHSQLSSSQPPVLAASIYLTLYGRVWHLSSLAIAMSKFSSRDTSGCLLIQIFAGLYSPTLQIFLVWLPSTHLS